LKEEFDSVKTNRILIAILMGLIIFTQGACGKQVKTEAPRFVEINDVVKEAFLTDKGFSDELSKHMTKEVFNKTNIYNIYPVNSPEFKKPFKIDFSLKEISQRKENDIVQVYMIYSVMINDSNNKPIGGSGDIPITFTVQVQKTGSGWTIIKKEEKA